MLTGSTYLPWQGEVLHGSEGCSEFFENGSQNGNVHAVGNLSSFVALRIEKEKQWTIQLRYQLDAVVQNHQMIDQQPDQIWLFGSRARGNWDGYSDTDLVVVAEHQVQAARWVDHWIDAEVVADVIAMDRKAWQKLPNHDSAIWGAVCCKRRHPAAW